MLNAWISGADPLLASLASLVEEAPRIPTTWLVIGGIGQAVFFSRFLVQWIVSESKKRSVIPTAFWWLSLLGASILLAYAIFRKDPIFIIGQVSGFLIYIRNLLLIQKEKTPGT
ncbi:MAG TPA: hypothetical protein ENK02_08290 [Planctomycetes bacterium]|nr:hypothetical protein [Planctomycetota bacterium]